MGKLKLITLSIVFGVGIAALTWFVYPYSWALQMQSASAKWVQSVKQILRLSVLEVNLNQLYEVSRDNVRIATLPIPFTKQKSLMSVGGRALVGYDLEKAQVSIDAAKRELWVTTPPAQIIALETDFRFVDEQDTFLNRIVPADRNETMQMVRRSLMQSLLTNALRQQAQDRMQQVLGEIEQWSGYRCRHRVTQAAVGVKPDG